MKKNLLWKTFILVVSLVIFTSCVDVPESTSTTSDSDRSAFDFWQPDSTSNGDSSSSGTNTSGSTTYSFLPHELSWYSNQAYSQNILLDSDFRDIIYLRGNQIHKYLDLSINYHSHCLKVNFTGNDSKTLVARVIPKTTYDYTTNKAEKLFKLDLGDSHASSIDCDFADDSVYELSNVCDTCISTQNSASVNFYESSDSATLVSENAISFSQLNLSINPNNDTTDTSNSCSDISCMAQGFNCCLQGQCVIDGTVKSSAVNANPDQYALIQQLLLTNPSAYVSYPEYFYVCSDIIPTDPGTGSGSGSETGSDDPVQNANDLLLSMQNDFLCIEEMKEQAVQSPFHFNPYNEEGDYEACIMDDEEDELYFINVMQRLYDRCGCSANSIEEAVTNCPNYEYRVQSTDINGTPTSITCFTPPVIVDIPFQNLSININARRVPHRFFSSEGEPVDDIAQFFEDPNLFQEGDIFLYQDNERTMPLNGSYNMNSILGAMSLSLNQALPAQVIDIDFDEVYVVSATSGYFTPCPSCARDSWFAPFTSIPGSSNGRGLKAAGHTTTRDNWGGNSTYGNYEDTIFGRACWVPPTMLPFSHIPGDDLQSQRLNRLQTQAALYMNGYQRDWYGFNQGALIASFNGINWFAVGTGRIVRATSSKLYLAINAPFADLSEPTNHVVSVNTYEGISMAALADFDPGLPLDHPRQNSAGSCQQFHSCSTDSECISKLGWEYTCANVQEQKSQWPVFDSDGNELEGETQELTIEGILHQESLPSGGSQRCVYRGAGAPCRRDLTNVTNTDLREIMACAPNFYCASLEDEVFNNEVARFTGVLENLPLSNNHLYGQDANILGRPRHYIVGGTLAAFPTEIAETIAANIQTLDPNSEGQEGICRPGKAVPMEASEDDDYVSPLAQHDAADAEFRTDYISQIGGCNASLTSDVKYLSCPVLDSDGNYLYTSNTEISEYSDDPSEDAISILLAARVQNSCGGESLNDNGESPFTLIESGELTTDNSMIIFEKTLVKNACFRRAGSVCHTDLDCSPGKLHGEKVGLYGQDYFGNTPERKYWEEHLVCGQAQPKPSLYDTNYKTYDMSKNRCCREIGSELTIYSEKTVDLSAETDQLDTSNFAYQAPDDTSRYSRFSVSENMMSRVTASTDTSSDASIITRLQWLSVSEVAQRTCCGGGWVRKFADGSNNWTQSTRVSLDVTNFKCLNYRHPIVNTEDPTLYDTTRSIHSNEFSSFCSGEGTGEGDNGCMEVGMNTAQVDGFNLTKPVKYSGGAISATILTGKFAGSHNAPYPPKSIDQHEVNYFNYSEVIVADKRGATAMFQIPAYMGNGSTITSVKIILLEDETTLLTCTTSNGACKYTVSALNHTLEVDISGHTVVEANEEKDLGIEIKFNVTHLDFNEAGNYLYYLDKLGKLELSGIPQIFFEPILCNDENENLVPGIFDSEVKVLSDFESDDNTFSASGAINRSYANHEETLDVENNGSASADTTNPNNKATNVAGLQHDAVFSSHEFQCCTELGQVTASQGLCCSGFAVENNSTKELECKLPSGTNLSVYFNRFVSSDGVGDNQPAGGFKTEEDFDAYTGAPVMREDVYQKLGAMGVVYCASTQTRRGGAFGVYSPEPKFGTITSTNVTIVDSPADIGSGAGDGATESGHATFYSGYRWNHHVYCQ